MRMFFDEKPYTYEIQNVVATATMDIAERIDLNVIAEKCRDVEYDKVKFPGLIMKIHEPKSTCLIFSTGKLVLTGLKKEEDAKLAVQKILKKVKKAKLKLPFPEITIQNMVASGDFGMMIDLNMAVMVMEDCMYEPEVFPGMIHRVHDPRAVFLIFSTGRIVCTGTKTVEQTEEAIDKLYKKLKELGFGDDTDDDYDDISII